MTHVKLPAGFEDWVEVSPILRGTLSRQLTVTIEECVSNSYGMVINTLGTRHFAPPKPKPVLPDVKPGAVLRFTSKTGKPERAVRNYDTWSVYGAGTQGRMNSKSGDWSLEWRDADLLDRVNSDGFTVELEGL